MNETMEGLFEQGTSAWFDERRGKLTCSRMPDLFAGPAARRRLALEIIYEQETGQILDKYVSADMLRGNELEQFAREAYEFETGLDVHQTGFVPHPSIAWLGGSPDGLVWPDGLIEIKCPRPINHLETVLTNTIPAKYLPQIHGLMWVTYRQWCDYVSYCPEYQPVPLHIIRIYQDDEWIAKIADSAESFWRCVEARKLP